MDYEKKYNEALERMKSWARGEHPECFSEAQKAAEFVFPELKESEGEGIRKNIISFLRSKNGYMNPDEDWDFHNRWLPWLEKQDGQKATTVWHDVSEVPDEMQELLVEWESPDATWHNIAFYDAETKAFRHLKQPIKNVTRWAYISDILTQSVTKTSEQEPKSYKEAEKACLEYRKFREDCGIKDPVMLDEIEEAYYNGATSIQKPDWSEEDEEELGIAIKYLQREGQWDSATWLKSLKNRVRPKQIWSEEDDKRLINTTISFLNHYADKGYENAVECIDWLKSLKTTNVGNSSITVE